MIRRSFQFFLAPRPTPLVPLFLALTGFFGLLLNPYWVRHGDSELMIGIARSLARGEGFKFNGQPIGIVPPLWPALMAAVMHVSRSFLVLKLLSTASLVGFLLLSYDVLLHVVPQRVAVACVLLTASLQPVFVLATLEFSDSLFSMLAMGWLSVALRVGSSRNFVPMLAASLLLTIATIAVRWAGAAWVLLVVAGIFHGQPFPRRLDRRGMAVLLNGAVAVASFFIIRRIMFVDPKTLDDAYAIFPSGTYRLWNVNSIATQLSQFGLWLTGLFAAPLTWWKAIRLPVQFAGWALFALLCVGSVRLARKRIWAGAAAAGYFAFLAAMWPNPVARYLVPAAPLLAAAGWEALRSVSRGPMIVAVGVVAINMILYLNDLVVMRRSNFYAHFQGGTNQTLIDAAENFRQIDDGRPMLVSETYYNFGRPLTSDGFRRAFSFLTDRPTLTDPDIWGEPTATLVEKLRARGAGWYLYRPPTKLLMHVETSSPGADLAWRMYRIDGDVATRVVSPPAGAPLTQVPP